MSLKVGPQLLLKAFYYPILQPVHGSINPYFVGNQTDIFLQTNEIAFRVKSLILIGHK